MWMRNRWRRLHGNTWFSKACTPAAWANSPSGAPQLPAGRRTVTRRLRPRGAASRIPAERLAAARLRPLNRTPANSGPAHRPHEHPRISGRANSSRNSASPLPRARSPLTADEAVRDAKGLGGADRRESAGPRRRPRQGHVQERLQGRRASREDAGGGARHRGEDARPDARHAPDRPRRQAREQGARRRGDRHREASITSPCCSIAPAARPSSSPAPRAA